VVAEPVPSNSMALARPQDDRASPAPTQLVTIELTAPTSACTAKRWPGFVPIRPGSPRWVSATMSTNPSREARRCSIIAGPAA
jgi:hypothetical protein